MKFLKKLLSVLLKIFIITVIVLVVFIGGLLIWHFATIQKSEEYLPGDFLVYLKINSMKDIYDNVIDLRAADVIFSSSEDLKSIYKALMEFKSTDLADNYFFRKLLEVKTDLIITEDYSPVLVFDPGLLSIPTRFVPLLTALIRIDGVVLNTVRKEGVTIYNLKPDDETDLYISFNNNLIFFSTVEEHVLELFRDHKNGENLKSSGNLVPLKGKIKTGGFADIYLNSESLTGTVVEGNKDLELLIEEVLFNTLSAVTFKISNEDIFLSAFTGIETDNPLINNFLNYKSSTLQVLPYLPDTTNVFSSVNFKSFRDILDIILFFKGEELTKTIKDIDQASKLIFQIGIDKLLFDWIGSEVGLFTVTDAPEPVIFIKIDEKEKWNLAMDKIKGSIFFNENDTLLLDNVRINKINFPPFLQSMVGLFVKGVETPYYVEMGDFVFFTMNAEILARLANGYKEGSTLIRTKEYKEITKNTPKNANLFLYYDLSSKLPDFLASNNMVTRILKLYEKGLMAIRFNKTELKIDLSATGVAGKKTIAFPGYPKPLLDGAVSGVICQGLTGSRDYKLFYVNKENDLIIQDVFDDTLITNGVEKNSEILLEKNRASGQNEIFVYTGSGAVYKFDSAGDEVAPFPLVTTLKNSFPPVSANNRLALFSIEEKVLYFMDKGTGDTSSFPYEFKKPLLVPPSFADKFIAFYPKSFGGEIFLTDYEGTLLDGWPQKGGGISFCSPVIIPVSSQKNRILFLTQSGVINLWNEKGEPEENFPIDLDGVYYTNPAVISAAAASLLSEKKSEKAIFTLGSNGLVTATGLDGEILKEKSLAALKGKGNKIKAFDFDKDGIEEVFIYGETNYIYGLGKGFEVLPGFPVKGSKEPYFVDLNYDGLYEMITGSFDGNVYAYTLNK